MHYWLRVFFTKFSLNRNDPVIVNSHDGALKICDVTQFYSPYSGGVRRYVEERQRYINAGGQHQHVLVIPGGRNDSTFHGRSIVHRIQSPRIDRVCDYRTIINLERVRGNHSGRKTRLDRIVRSLRNRLGVLNAPACCQHSRRSFVII